MKTAAQVRASAREYMRKRRAAGRCMTCPAMAADDGGPHCKACRVRRKKRAAK